MSHEPHLDRFEFERAHQAEEYRARASALARGEYEEPGRVPRKPAVWAAAIKDAAQAYRFPTLLLPLLLLVVMGIGSYDSMHDVRGDRMLGALPMFAPAVLAIWWSIRGAFMKEPNIGRLLARIYSGAYGSIPLILGGMLTTTVLWQVPSNRAAVEDASWHYWWAKIFGSASVKSGTASLGEQLLITGLVGLLIAAFAGMLTVFVLVLPIVGIRRSREVFGAELPNQRRAVGYITVGFAILVVGIALVVLGGPDMSFAAAGEWLSGDGSVGSAGTGFGAEDWMALGWIFGVGAMILSAVVIGIGFIHGFRDPGERPDLY